MVETVTGFDGTPVPYALVAVTVMVYFVAAVRPEITQVRAGAAKTVPVDEQLKPPGFAVAM